jgi:hypothetical protein
MSINSEKQPNIRGEVVQLRRIADAIEEILRLVKADQERSRAYMEREKNGLPTIETDDENEKE